MISRLAFFIDLKVLITMNANHDKVFEEGVVIKKSGGGYQVHLDGDSIACQASPGLHDPSEDGDRNIQHKKGVTGRRDPVAVGDVVRLVRMAGQEYGQIVEILPRRSCIARRGAIPWPGAHAFEQVIASNVDQVVPVMAAAEPTPHWRLLDRYLVAAEAADLPAAICITKLDLVQDGGKGEQALYEAAEVYRRVGYTVLMVSAYSGTNLAELKLALQGRTSLLLGKSGVGKSTLLNALQPGLGLRVKEVSQATGKGRHTTTHLEMFPFEFGGAMIDTPGSREFGLWDVASDDLAYFFPEMRPFIGQCKFGLDCQHDEEPGCAVRKAVMDGRISPARYQSYMLLKSEV
jgi:ribosome biogenesis GTPase